MLMNGCSAAPLIGFDGVLAVVGSEPTGLQEAAEGELVASAGGCLALRTVEGDFLLVWPPGVTLDSSDGRVVVKVPGDSEGYTVGETVKIGGGGYSGGGGIEFEVPEDCAELTQIYLVNGQG